MRPGPLTPTFAWPFVLIPVSAATLVPLQPSVASLGPVIEKPFRFSAILGTPNAMHGAPATWQETSPTSREFSDRTNVRTILPLMSSARAPLATNSVATTRQEQPNRLASLITHLA